MKRGINAVVLSLVMMMGTAGYTAYAAPSAAKNDAAQTPASSVSSGEAKKDKSSLTSEDDALKHSDGAVSINTATADELAQALNGVGGKKAQAIVSYREEYGPFKSLDDLKQVPGMGDALVERNKAWIKL